MDRRIAGIVWPFSLLVIPKCPLCVLPLLAALGIAAPPGAAISVAIACIAAGWAWFIFRVASSLALRAGSAALAALVIAGRAFSVLPPAATYAAAAFMVVFGFAASRRCTTSRERPNPAPS